MKTLLLLSILFSAAIAAANDTLTRGQIYSYTVGDTFDYRLHDYDAYDGEAGGQPYSDSSLSYKRYVVMNIYWAPDSSSKTIIRNRIFPEPVVADTLVLNNLQEYQVILDSGWANTGFGMDTIITDSLPDYFGHKTNYAIFFCCSPGWSAIVYADGLGEAISFQFGGAMGWGYGDSTVLVYYSGSAGKFGQPYTSFPTNDTPATLSKFSAESIPIAG